MLSINITNALLNPPDAPAPADVLARQTGRDTGVRDYILATPGAARIVDDAVHALTALLAANGNWGPGHRWVRTWREPRQHQRVRGQFQPPPPPLPSDESPDPPGSPSG
ncbi:hypothetical protein [Streptomyces lavendulocolor]|uniref:hypothetical protein n=1 Tax=Streptomyces lavendulocolor TaxID=67316 RepID=UPI003C2C748B